MKVKRIVCNIDTPDIAAAKCFYQDVLGLDLLMDHVGLQLTVQRRRWGYKLVLQQREAPIRLRLTYRLKSMISMLRLNA